MTADHSDPVSPLQSATGEVEADHVCCRPSVHQEGHCVFGGDFSVRQSGAYSVFFALEVINYKIYSGPLLILDVYDNAQAKAIVAERVISRGDLAGNARLFSLNFEGKEGQRVEFRVYWRGHSTVKVFSVTLKQRRGDSEVTHFQKYVGTSLRRVRTVSAIIPCYNGAPWLADAITSIQSQSRKVDEIILVDDCSTDDSGSIAEKHNVIVVRNQINMGEGFSRNVGLKHATGDFIAWLDADDLWMPHHIHTLTALLERNANAVGAFAAVQQFGLRNKLIRGYIPVGAPSNVFWPAFCDWMHTTIGSMVSRDALMSIGGFNEQERYSVDFDLWLRLARSHQFVCTHEATSLWRWHDKQQSVQQEEQIAAVYRFRRRYWEQEHATGDPIFASELEQCMIKIWLGELADAWNNQERDKFLFVWGLGSLLPKLPSRISPEWDVWLPGPTA